MTAERFCEALSVALDGTWCVSQAYRRAAGGCGSQIFRGWGLHAVKLIDGDILRKALLIFVAGSDSHYTWQHRYEFVELAEYVVRFEDLTEKRPDILTVHKRYDVPTVA